MLAYIDGLPPAGSAFSRKVLGKAADWDVKTELAAATVDMLQVVVKALGVDFEITPVKRPALADASTEVEAQPEATISASEIMSFLKG